LFNLLTNHSYLLVFFLRLDLAVENEFITHWRSTLINNLTDKEVFMKITTRSQAKEKSLKRYFTGNPCMYGHISERGVSNGTCLECRREYKRKNKEKIKAATKKYYQENKEQEKIRAIKFRVENREQYRLIRRRCNNKNPNLAFERFTRGTLIRLQNITNKKRLSLLESDIGYTQGQFKEHLESLFAKGMGWSNRSEWHIDHIKSLSSFIKEGVTDIKIINALSNLQPLWASENISKGAKF
jgi:hypothetical protein